MDTIYALSSGGPPSAIAVIRISGARSEAAMRALAGTVPEPRRAKLVGLKHPSSGELLDRAVILFFPGPGSATGEDLAELHLHGGRSVVRAVTRALAALEGLREAAPGEFTRRAFENGRIDLAEAEGLADLLLSETESQRRSALAVAGGALSRLIDQWQDVLLQISAELEATLDFADEGDVADEFAFSSSPSLLNLIGELERALARPGAERLRDGIRVAIAGPPNAGKSSLLNYLAGREAAITSPLAGTTRDLVEAPVALGGTPFVLTDTAGLRESEDEIEAIGVERARSALRAADIILWLGDPGHSPDSDRTVRVKAKADLTNHALPGDFDVAVSSRTGEGMDDLIAELVRRARHLLPWEGEIALNERHRAALAQCLSFLEEARFCPDPIIRAELLRQARNALDSITGKSGVEEMLDGLFGRFCIGK